MLSRKKLSHVPKIIKYEILEGQKKHIKSVKNFDLQITPTHPSST